MINWTLGVLLVAGSVTVAAQKPAPEGGDKIVPEPVTLTGCVAEGARKDTFVLSDVQKVARPDVPVGTSGTASAVAATSTNVVYWLDSAKLLRGHVGRRVEIQGTFDDDVDKASIKPDGDTVKITTERTKTVEVEAGTEAAKDAVSGASRRLTYKVKVASVRDTGTACRQ